MDNRNLIWILFDKVGLIVFQIRQLSILESLICKVFSHLRNIAVLFVLVGQIILEIEDHFTDSVADRLLGKDEFRHQPAKLCFTDQPGICGLNCLNMRLVVALRETD